MSSALPPAVQRTSTERPPSVGRDSSQYRSPPTSATDPSRTAPEEISCEVIGEVQEPYGAVVAFAVTMRRAYQQSRPDEVEVRLVEHPGVRIVAEHVRGGVAHGPAHARRHQPV